MRELRAGTVGPQEGSILVGCSLGSLVRIGFMVM